MNYSENELADMVLIMGECLKNSLLASRVYKERYPQRRAPQPSAFARLLERFSTTKCVKYKTIVKPKPTLTEYNELQVMAAVVENPRRSLKDISSVVNISKTSVRRVLKKYKFHPYRIQLHQLLNADDFRMRRNFCEWAVERIDANPFFFNMVLFSDESTFHKNGHVNRHNMHYYSDENPHIMRQVDAQHRWSVNVWAGILGERIIGPYFFGGSLTGAMYLNFLQNDLPELLENVPLHTRRNLWIQHDGAPPHFCVPVRDFLNQHYPNRWIGRGGPIPWPPRSPDLTKPDYFLWGFVKNIVYSTPPTTREDMMARIREAFTMITVEMLENVNSCFHDRALLCIEQNGRHFEHLIN